MSQRIEARKFGSDDFGGTWKVESQAGGRLHPPKTKMDTHGYKFGKGQDPFILNMAMLNYLC